MHYCSSFWTRFVCEVIATGAQSSCVGCCCRQGYSKIIRLYSKRCVRYNPCIRAIAIIIRRRFHLSAIWHIQRGHYAVAGFLLLSFNRHSALWAILPICVNDKCLETWYKSVVRNRNLVGLNCITTSEGQANTGYEAGTFPKLNHRNSINLGWTSFCLTHVESAFICECHKAISTK